MAKAKLILEYLYEKARHETKTKTFHICDICANDFWIAWDKLLFLQTTPDGVHGPDRFEAHLLNGNAIVFSTEDHPDNRRFVEEVIS